MVDASLEDAAAMAVGGDLDAVGTDSVVDELVILRGKAVEALLDDVVAVEVLDQSHHTGVKSDDDNGNLLRGRQELDHLLDSPSSVHVERDVDQLRSNCLNNHGALFVAAVLQKLLAEVVSKGI